MNITKPYFTGCCIGKSVLKHSVYFKKLFMKLSSKENNSGHMPEVLHAADIS